MHDMSVLVEIALRPLRYVHATHGCDSRRLAGRCVIDPVSPAMSSDMDEADDIQRQQHCFDDLAWRGVDAQEVAAR